jgi:hypothetical protein
VGDKTFRACGRDVARGAPWTALTVRICVAIGVYVGLGELGTLCVVEAVQGTEIFVRHGKFCVR